MADNICIYHGNCADGFTAAWAVYKRFGDAMEYYSAFHGDAPPDVTGKRVVIVDFSYPEKILREMVSKAKTLLVLDHHKTAAEGLAWMPKATVIPLKYDNIDDPWSSHIGFDPYFLNDPDHHPCAAWFDMDKSGARLAWEFFHPKEPIPALVKHVEDRDLWRFDLEGTREIQDVVFSHEYDFNVWDGLAVRCENYKSAMVDEGKAIGRKHFKDIKELVAASKRQMIIGGRVVWCANLPYTMASDACHAMCKEEMYPTGSGQLDIYPPFAASYWDGPKGRTFSLRSVGDFDVSKVAALYGGGGHKNAAGFTKPIGWEGDSDE